jgi:hypothetical protein
VKVGRLVGLKDIGGIEGEGVGGSVSWIKWLWRRLLIVYNMLELWISGDLEIDGADWVIASVFVVTNLWICWCRCGLFQCR